MSKRVTTKDIAKLAGVSRTSVSFVLNNVPGVKISEETRQRILDAAQQLDYHPDAAARSMVSGKTRVIGFAVRQNVDQVFADQFIPEVLHGLAQSAATFGYRILFEPISPEVVSGAYTKLIAERHVDGIILSGPRFDDAELLRVHAEGWPVVLLGQMPQSDLSFVDVDNIGGAQLAVRHLLQLGHTRIGLITNASLEYTASADRLTGYKQALIAAGVDIDESLIQFGDFSPQGGERAMSQLLALSEPPTAVFIASDTVALGALQTLRQHKKRVPEDIAIVGFDDIPLVAFIDPPLTTVKLPAFALGWNAAQMVIQHIINGKPDRPAQMILETELVVRRSCGTQDGVIENAINPV